MFYIFKFFLLSLTSFNIYAFTLNNSVNLTFFQNEVKVNVANITCSNIGVDVHEIRSIVADAVDQYWNKSPTSRLKLRAGNVISADAAYGTGLICNPATDCDPNPTLAVANDILITCNNNAGNFTSTAILAVTVPNNTTGKQIVGSLIMLNDRAGTQFANKSRDEKISIIAHELGHAFGLGHSPVADSLMYYSTVNMRKSLGADDIDGITYLYPKQQPINCGSIDDNNTPKQWLGLLLGIGLIAFINKFQLRYLKLLPRT